ncbi:hypothetical protein SDC9_111762 [bioreactor metagenome]|uniref:Uncharacterized protein n=1 Tax=bioreactor metagenome TaxID=1076179 RepID=A0A645BK05_9ZZZZ
MAYREPDGKWNDKREKTENKTLILVGDKFVQIEFQAYNEHNVQQPDG